MPLTPHQAQYIAHDLTLQHAGAGPAAWPQGESETVKAKPEQAYVNRQPQIHHGARDEFREIARLFAASFERHSAILKTTKETSKTAKETTQETGVTGLETPRKQPENTKERLTRLKQAGQVRHVGPSKGGHWQVTGPDTQGTI